MDYNNERFHLKNHDIVSFDGPRAGEQAIHFTLSDTSGNTISLDDFRGKWVVLEMGSASCPMYARNIRNINELRGDYPDVEFLVVYVREAHPGERLRTHKTFEQKLLAAKHIKDSYGEQRRVLVDSLEGDMHINYGMMPNSVYVINPDGKVIYRCDWTMLNELKNALDNRDLVHVDEHATLTQLGNPPLKVVISTLFKAGFIALWDFIKMIPYLDSAHEKADKYYAEHGSMARSTRQPGLKK